MGDIARLRHGDGHGHIRRLSEELGVSYDHLRHVLSGRRPTPESWRADLLRLMTGDPRAVAPPPAGLPSAVDRDGPCGEAIDPHLDRLLGQAVAAGWHPAEVTTAVLTWAVHTIADAAGTGPARQTLREAEELLDLRPVPVQDAHQDHS